MRRGGEASSFSFNRLLNKGFTMALPITSLFVAFFTIFLVALSFPVTLRRIKIGAPTGDAPDEILRRRIRAQGNFTEYVPLGLIAIGLVEAAHAPALFVVGLGASLALGRVSHAAGMWTGAAALRVVGMVLTYTALIMAAGRLIANA